MKEEIQRLKVKIAAILYVSLFICLISSELINSFLNNRFDLLGFSRTARLAAAFKPTVLVVYIIFTSTLYSIILRYLKSLFYYHTGRFSPGENKELVYSRARKAAVAMPKMVIIFQITVWIIGTTAYYALKKWQAESGIPYAFGLMLKISSGALGALYVVFFINLILMDLKKKLNMTSIRPAEIDSFAKKRDMIAIIAAAFYLVVQSSYIAWYYSQKSEPVTLGEFALSVLPPMIFLMLMSIGPNLISRIEFRLHVKEVLKEMEIISNQKEIGEINPIYLTNFDELGELADVTNRVVERFSGIMQNISGAINHLADSAGNLKKDSDANARATNDQATAVAEVVATMEDSNRLSRYMGEIAGEVEGHAKENLEKVGSGIEGIKKYLDTMEKLKESNTRSINFVFSLNENIKMIMDVSFIIKQIADQVKIIAFNAELEAAAAGEAGKNFEIVASEVRRLADNTVTAASEIREKINYIEKESRKLYDASQETTDLIDTSWDLSQQTQISFSAIQDTSNATSLSAKSISDNIKMQIGGFEQILETMKEISRASRSVSEGIKTTAVTTTGLEELIASLEKLIN
ncbi:MAG: methyl-accepting chemotaxis protein [Spirochaetales bacterium]|nr:methyl-accepting chemotaxis protein [Spirochaetales bacterium]